MKNLKQILFIILITLVFNSNLYADIPHFLDFKYILNQSDAGKKAQTFLKNKLENGVKQLKNKEKKIISPEEYKKKVTELRKKVTSLQKERNTLLSSVSQQRSKARTEILKVLNPALTSYMKEKKIRMVVDKKSLLIGDENLDITNDIIKILNQKLKSINLK